MRLPWKLVSREGFEIVCQLAADHLEHLRNEPTVPFDEIFDDKREGELVDRAMRWEPGDYYTYCLSCETARYITKEQLVDYSCDCQGPKGTSRQLLPKKLK